EESREGARRPRRRGRRGGRRRSKKHDRPRLDDAGRDLVAEGAAASHGEQPVGGDTSDDLTPHDVALASEPAALAPEPVAPEETASPDAGDGGTASVASEDHAPESGNAEEAPAERGVENGLDNGTERPMRGAPDEAPLDEPAGGASS